MGVNIDDHDDAVFSANIVNSGTISTAQTGIIVENLAIFAGGITNSSRITAGSADFFIEGVTTFGGPIVNNGTIAATHHAAIFLSSIAVFGGDSAGGGIVNTGTGRIVGAKDGIEVGFPIFSAVHVTT